MADIIGDGDMCVDCLMWAANDDTSGNYRDETELAAWLDDIGRNWPTGHIVPTDDETAFSSSPCGVCGSTLGGARQSFVVLGTDNNNVKGK